MLRLISTSSRPTETFSTNLPVLLVMNLLILTTISIYQISGLQFLHVLIGSHNLEYPWIFPVLQTERKMARRFAKVSEEEIVAIN